MLLEMNQYGKNDKVIGWVTSGGYAHYVEKIHSSRLYSQRKIAQTKGQGAFRN